MALKPFKKSIVTPVGVAIYPWLHEPDTRFGDPTYKVNLRIEGEEAKIFLSNLKQIRDEAIEYLKQDNPKLTAENFKVPVVEATNEDGSVIENAWDVKTKAKAFFKQKDGTLQPNNLTIVDSQKNPIGKETQIWGGSKLKVALSVGAVSTAIYSGLMLRINGVQVLDLVSGGSGATNLFDKEDGFVTAEPVSKPIASEGEDDFDF